MKQILSKIVFGLLALTLLLTVTSQTFAQTPQPTQAEPVSISQQEEKTIIFFYGQGCPHCAKVEKWFQEEGIYDSYPLDSREIYFNKSNTVLFNDTLDALGVPVNQRGVPTLVVGDKVIVGDGPIIAQFREASDAYLGADNIGTIDEVTQSTEKEVVPLDDSDSSLSLWIIISASLVDAINPCAFAVLVILLTTVLSKKDRKKALASGVAFTVSIFISYMLMGLGVYAALGSIGIASTITKVVGVLAIILGLLNLKNYFWYDKGGLIEVPKSWRPKMSKIIESVTSPGGAFAIGFLVSLFLLPCTSGPYIVVLGLLAENPLDSVAIGYLLLYNLIFVSPMLLITFLVYRGLNPERVEMLRQQNLERLHLFAGLILIAIGVFVLATV